MVAGSTVTVTATKTVEASAAPPTVSQTVQVPTNATSIDLDFADDLCGAGANQPCALNDGEWDIVATHDSPGKSPADSTADLTLFIDTTPPTLTMSITDDQTSLPIGATPTITFSSGANNIAGLDFSEVANSTPATATLAAATFPTTPANSFTATLTALAAGTTTISVPAEAFTDEAGNANTEAFSLDITVNANAAAPTITTPAANATVLSPFTATGTAPPGAEVTVSIGASPNTVTETVTATPGGNWSADLTTTLTGAQTLSVTAATDTQAAAAAVTRSITLATVATTTTTDIAVTTFSGRIPSAEGLGYRLFVAGCETGITRPLPQTEVNGTPSGTAPAAKVTHKLDYRCDWTIIFSHKNNCDVRSARVGVRTGVGATDLNDSGTINRVAFNFNRDVTNEELTFVADPPGGGGSVTWNLRTIKVGSIDNIGRCTALLLITAGDGNSHNLGVPSSVAGATVTNMNALEGENTNYKLVANTCSRPSTVPGGNPSTGKPSDQPRSLARLSSTGSLITTVADYDDAVRWEYRHNLEIGCNWSLEFLNPPDVSGKCSNVAIGYVAPGDEETDVVLHGSRSSVIRLSSDVDNTGFLWTDAPGAEKLPVNRLRITYIDRTTTVDGAEVNQCATPVTFSSRTGEREAGVSFSVATGRNRQACTPNSRSVAVADLPTMLASVSSQTYELGNNCNWLITFGSENPNCAATAYFIKLTGDGSRELHSLHKVPVDSYPRQGDNERYKANVTKTFPFYVKARPGDTANFRLTGKADGMYLSLPENEGGEVKITEVNFTGCALPQGYARIAVVDDVGGGMDLEDVNLTYTFEPTACVGQGLPATQTNADAIEDMEQVAGNQDVRVHFLNYFCSWEVSYSIPNDCQVTPTLRSTNLVPYSTAVHLPTQYGGFKWNPIFLRRSCSTMGMTRYLPVLSTLAISHLPPTPALASAGLA